MELGKYGHYVDSAKLIILNRHTSILDLCEKIIPDAERAEAVAKMIAVSCTDGYWETQCGAVLSNDLDAFIGGYSRYKLFTGDPAVAVVDNPLRGNENARIVHLNGVNLLGDEVVQYDNDFDPLTVRVFGCIDLYGVRTGRDRLNYHSTIVL